MLVLILRVGMRKLKSGVCVCVCVLPSILRGSPGPPFAEIGIRKTRPPGNPEEPRNYPLAR